MTPPEADGAGKNAGAADVPPAVSVQEPLRLITLSRRADFLRAAQARRQGMPGFLLQARERRLEEADGAIRIGYTCSKKLGNAVARNRAKRRLREIARAVLPHHARPGWDYVLVGRPETTASRDFAALCDDLRHALTMIHAPKTRAPTR